VSSALGTRAEWLAGPTALLAEEKELTRSSDELATLAAARPHAQEPRRRPEGWPRQHDEYE
jgi:predicted dithiol-disulfide oxidoreductase (DUF899 family)